MTTYLYEILGTPHGEEPRYFEWRQSMRDPALETHPETGEPVRRVVLGGLGILGTARHKAAEARPSGGGHCCGGGGCCG